MSSSRAGREERRPVSNEPAPDAATEQDLPAGALAEHTVGGLKARESVKK